LHLVGEARQLSRPLPERRSLDERAATLLAANVAKVRQVTQGLADGHLADLEPGAELVLGRQPAVGSPVSCLDPLEELGLDLMVQRRGGAAVDNHAVVRSLQSPRSSTMSSPSR